MANGTVTVLGVECVEVRWAHNREVLRTLAADVCDHAVACELCPVGRSSHPACTCSAYSNAETGNVFVEAKYLPILKMRGLIHED